jgi:hypothetical protein
VCEATTVHQCGQLRHRTTWIEPDDGTPNPRAQTDGTPAGPPKGRGRVINRAFMGRAHRSFTVPAACDRAFRRPAYILNLRTSADSRNELHGIWTKRLSDRLAMCLTAASGRAAWAAVQPRRRPARAMHGRGIPHTLLLLCLF